MTPAQILQILELRALADAATPGPWFARGRHLSRVPNDSGMGATLHTNHIGVMAEREDAAFIAAARTREPLLAAGVLDLTRQLAEANRELERWRHGVTIEGDYVCPDSLALSEALRVNVDLTRQLAEARAGNERLQLALDYPLTSSTQLTAADKIRELEWDNEDAYKRMNAARAEIERLRDLEQSAMESWFDQIEDHKGTAQQLATARESLREACDLLAIARLGDSPPLREQADVIRKRGGL